ncbi:MAG: GntR family transcriptional regulator [Hyphomicrobiaceae bacterium]|nr:GntR family transcriptional regulator [Hyphomicrobiaceae bacterium]
MAVPIKSCALLRDPLYLQVCELLARQIASGVWAPNASLPNELELARDLGVSSGTVRKALEKLESDRLVVRRQGRGTFVVDQTTPEASSRFDRLRQTDGSRLVLRAKIIESSCGAPTPNEQKALRLGPGEPVARKRRVLSTSGRLFGLEDACLALSRLPGLAAADLGDWCLTVLAQRHGVHASRASERLRAVAAPQETAAILSLKPGTTLLRLDRVISSTDHAPIEWRILSCELREEYYLAEVS